MGAPQQLCDPLGVYICIGDVLLQAVGCPWEVAGGPAWFQTRAIYSRDATHQSVFALGTSSFSWGLVLWWQGREPTGPATPEAVPGKEVVSMHRFCGHSALCFAQGARRSLFCMCGLFGLNDVSSFKALCVIPLGASRGKQRQHCSGEGVVVLE